MNIIEFTKIMKVLTMSYNKEFDEDMIRLWYYNFKDIQKEILYKSIQEIIKENKFFPSIAEVLDKCKKSKQDIKFEILEKMKLDNYFANGYEYDKAIRFLEKNIIPSWLKEDMKKYKTIQIENNKMLLEY